MSQSLRRSKSTVTAPTYSVRQLIQPANFRAAPITLPQSYNHSTTITAHASPSRHMSATLMRPR